MSRNAPDPSRRAVAAMIAAAGLSAAAPGLGEAQARPLSEAAAALKSEILSLAGDFSGQGDPDFSRQRQLEPLVTALAAAAPPRATAPLAQRLPALQGAWRQVWGPYDYRNDDRGVDPDLGVDEIHQVVFPGGFYYNVSPILRGRPDRRRERIGLLRGTYRISRERPADTLRVRFTSFRGVSERPAGRPIHTLAADAEFGRLDNEVTIVPGLIVRLFFGGGGLREVYTDDTLRIAFGADSVTDRRREALYVLRRV